MWTLNPHGNVGVPYSWGLCEPIPEDAGNRTYRTGTLTEFATHAQFAGCPGAALFLHVPAFESLVVHAVPPPQSVPPILDTQGPADTIPMLCKNPGKPVSLEQVLAWATAVNTVTTARPAISVSDDDTAQNTRVFRSFKVCIMV